MSSGVRIVLWLREQFAATLAAPLTRQGGIDCRDAADRYTMARAMLTGVEQDELLQAMRAAGAL